MFKLSRSLRRKVLATVLTGGVFFLVYEATVIDSRTVPREVGRLAAPKAGARMIFEATAYCRGQITASGVKVRAGIAAADPKVLPIGSVIQLDQVDDAYKGIYTVLDTGPEIEGREVDLYIWNCDEAVRFGRRDVRLTVLRLGWDQSRTGAGLD